jgi:DNA-binding Lrp family transcriptional regulator
MDQTPQTAGAAGLELRLTARLAIGFILDLAELGRMGAPMLDALLLAAIVETNVGRVLRDPELQAAYACLNTPPPDELRRPVSINALAESLSLPFETVRRHVRKLVAQGFCMTGPQGVLVPTAVICAPAVVQAQLARYRRVARFCDELAAVGALPPLPCALPPADDPKAPVRAVGRILSDYFFRSMEVIHEHTRDTLSGIVCLEVMRASAQHIAPSELPELMRSGWIPEESRIPVRAASVARALGVPYETTRRHLGWLIEDGFVDRREAGVVPSRAYLDGPVAVALAAQNLANLRRMHRQLATLDPGASSSRNEPDAG